MPGGRAKCATSVSPSTANLCQAMHWEEVKRGGDGAIQKWINNQLSTRSCLIVLIGSQTANRKWINYEISKAWNDKKGLLGIYIHRLLNQDGLTATKGNNPFS